MLEQKKAVTPARLAGATAMQNDNLIIPEASSDCQLTHHCDSLMSQAEERMAMDPSRYAAHWAIWVSLLFLKCGRKWPGVRDA